MKKHKDDYIYTRRIKGRRSCHFTRIEYECDQSSIVIEEYIRDVNGPDTLICLEMSVESILKPFPFLFISSSKTASSIKTTKWSLGCPPIPL